MVTVSWAAVLELMLPWLIALGTVALAIGFGALLVSDDATDERRRRSALVPKPASVPRQRRPG